MRDKLPPNLEQYLEDTEYNSPIDMSDNEALIYEVCAHTGLEFDSSKIIIENLFQVIRKQLLKEKKINLYNWGEFYLAKNCCVIFKASKSLKNKIGGQKLDFDKILTSELISYVAAYRVFKTNKSLAIDCMVELDKRRQCGYLTDYETEIENQAAILSSIGKGSVVKVYDESQIGRIIKEIRDLGINCMIFNQDQRLIHVGILDTVSKNKIETIVGVEEILSDKKAINATSTKLS
jgi:hypothetical protein